MPAAGAGRVRGGPGGTRLRPPGSGRVRAGGGNRGDPRAAGRSPARAGGSGLRAGQKLHLGSGGRVRVPVGTGLSSKPLNSSFGENLYNSRHNMLSCRTHEHQIFKMQALLKAL